MEEKKKVFIRGLKGRGNEVIDILTGLHNELQKLWNWFLTKEEAEAAAERVRKALKGE